MINQLIAEATEISERFWFVTAVHLVDRTARTVTIHLLITDDLLLQIFFSERSARLSFALIDPSGRLYGSDFEHGQWHRHPFGQTEIHEPTPAGMSPRPLLQFVAEVEEILLEHELI